MTIPRARARAVRALYATGQVSQAQTARKIGISRKSAERILHGRGPHAATAAEPIDANPDPDYPGKPRRCSLCGALVYPPCIACRTRREAAEAAAAPEPIEPAGEFTTELKPAHRRRYERVRAARLAATDAAVEEMTRQAPPHAGPIDPAAADYLYTRLGER